MGKTWDGGDIAQRPELWAEVLRVLKPGAHLVAFGGTRTSHRMACAIEDAGFEIRDTICWLYGSGFPKSHNVSKAIDKRLGAERGVITAGSPVKRMIPGANQHRDGWIKDNGREYTSTVTAAATPEAAEWEGWGTALKPAHEPIIIARKPISASVVENVLQVGCGALNIDACRIELAAGDALQSGLAGDYGRLDTASNDGKWGFKRVDRPAGLGRWPANVCHDGSDEVLAAFPDAPGQTAAVTGREPSTSTRNVLGLYSERVAAEPRGDSGSASRFFYTAKADSVDRHGTKHPTVKPLSLMQWLVRLVTPPGGCVLDPFSGSGTTGEACQREGFNAVLIEREAEYIKDIERRIKRISGEDTPLFMGAAE
jgi:site-specific DNA-methyltransferase (adenine-specific)